MFANLNGEWMILAHVHIMERKPRPG
jgi:hypothetical protein